MSVSRVVSANQGQHVSACQHVSTSVSSVSTSVSSVSKWVSALLRALSANVSRAVSAEQCQHFRSASVSTCQQVSARVSKCQQVSADQCSCDGLGDGLEQGLSLMIDQRNAQQCVDCRVTSRGVGLSLRSRARDGYV
jgi:hypothetical protein